MAKTQTICQHLLFIIISLTISLLYYLGRPTHNSLIGHQSLIISNFECIVISMKRSLSLSVNIICYHNENKKLQYLTAVSSQMRHLDPLSRASSSFWDNSWYNSSSIENKSKPFPNKPPLFESITLVLICYPKQPKGKQRSQIVELPYK